MLRFKEYNNLVEASTQAAKDMEEVIVSAAGGPKFVSTHISNSDEVGKRIVDTLKMSGDGGYMPDSTYPASAEWATYFKPGKPKGSTLTPKTDIIVGDRKISVKTGNAILMGGGINEATATFYTAMNNAGNITESVTNLKNHIDNLLPSTNMSKYNIKGNKTDLVKAGKFASIDILKRADEAHHKFKKDLREVFVNTPTFAREFTFEAMTGKVKFGGNGGTAEYFLVTDVEGLKPTMNKVTSSSDEYVGKLLKHVNPDVTFKSTQVVTAKGGKKTKTGYYTFWSAVKVGVNMIIEEEIKNSDLLTEGIMDVMKRVFSKALTWVKNFFKKIYKNINKSYKKLLEFMELEPVIKFNNNISW
jgi:hypothetical protein